MACRQSAIILEERAANTYENVAFTRAFSPSSGWRHDCAGQLAVSHAPRVADLAQGRARGGGVGHAAGRPPSSTRTSAAPASNRSAACCRSTSPSSTTGGAAAFDPAATQEAGHPGAAGDAGGAAARRDCDRDLGAAAPGTSRAARPGSSSAIPCAASGSPPTTTAGSPACRRAPTRLAFAILASTRSTKAPGTFRILVLGDSVTFGHGARLRNHVSLLARTTAAARGART